MGTTKNRLGDVLVLGPYSGVSELQTGLSAIGISATRDQVVVTHKKGSEYIATVVVGQV